MVCFRTGNQGGQISRFGSAAQKGCVIRQETDRGLIIPGGVTESKGYRRDLGSFCSGCSTFPTDQDGKSCFFGRDLCRCSRFSVGYVNLYTSTGPKLDLCAHTSVPITLHM